MANLQSGQMFGSYKIIRQIGAGGMATVYKAYQASMDRYVALKVLPHEFAHRKEFLGRFEQEIKVIAKLEHPHILPVYDCGECEGVPYLVMRYLDAGTLKDHIHSGSLCESSCEYLSDHLILAECENGKLMARANSVTLILLIVEPGNSGEFEDFKVAIDGPL